MNVKQQTVGFFLYLSSKGATNQATTIKEMESLLHIFDKTSQFN